MNSSIQLIHPSIATKGDPITDPRIGHLLAPQNAPDPTIKAVIIGFTSDQGVSINGGRPGANLAPDIIRRSFYNQTPNPLIPQHTTLLKKTKDLGNLTLTDNLSKNQELLATTIAPYLAQNITPIILGGGHETAYAHFLAYTQNKTPIQILNIDAHADVRQLKENKPHSGSPFRQALEHPSNLCKNYTVAGLQPHTVSKNHTDYITQQGGKIIWRKDTTNKTLNDEIQNLNHQTMLTLDLDAIDQSYAPGVSAPAANGLSPDIFYNLAQLAGQSPLIKSIDIVELNPNFDRDNQTSKISALTIWHFLLGLSLR